MRFKFFPIFLFALCLSLIGKAGFCEYVLLVDKEVHSLSRESTLYLIYRSGHNFYANSSYQAKCGRTKGRKYRQGDKKTPEGKYQISRVAFTGYSSKFGPIFYRLNYPNYYDRKNRRTGSGIGIHGGRRFRNTNGCIRLRNSRIKKLKIYVGEETPVLITPNTRRGFFPNQRRYRSTRFSNESAQILESIIDYSTSNNECIKKLSGSFYRK